MARIDLGTIEGFETMTPEQQIEALTAYEFPEPDYSEYVKKDVYDKTASDLAALKKKNAAQLSEDEKAKQERDDEIAMLRKQVEDMSRERLISGNTAQFLALGYDEALATETATAFVDGDSAKVFANQKKFLETHDKAYKAKLMGDTSTPPAGGKSTSVDYAKMAQEAQQSGNMREAVYYSRLAQENNSKKE